MKVGKAWFKQKLSQMPAEEKTRLSEKAIQKIEEGDHDSI